MSQATGETVIESAVEVHGASAVPRVLEAHGSSPLQMTFGAHVAAAREPMAIHRLQPVISRDLPGAGLSSASMGAFAQQLAQGDLSQADAARLTAEYLDQV